MINRTSISVSFYIRYRHFLYTLLVTMLLTISGSAFAESPIITYDQQHGLLAHDDLEPLLSIYADGRTRAVFPEIMKKEGVYGWRLSESIMQELRILAGKPGIQQFDEQAVQEKIEEKKQEGVLPLYISDSTTTILNVKQINESGEVLVGSSTNDGEQNTIAFEDVPDIAEEHPDVTELGDLLALQTQLEAILEQAGEENRTN